MRSGLASIISGLKEIGLSSDEVGTAEVVLAEVLNNVVEHAYGIEQSGNIKVGCATTESGVHFSVTDEGHPMPNGKTPLGICADINVPLDDMPEGGFGWFLIESLANDVEYKRLKNRNTLSFWLSLA